jgi:hypothetical protein
MSENSFFIYTHLISIYCLIYKASNQFIVLSYFLIQKVFDKNQNYNIFASEYLKTRYNSDRVHIMFNRCFELSNINSVNNAYVQPFIVI